MPVKKTKVKKTATTKTPVRSARGPRNKDETQKQKISVSKKSSSSVVARKVSRLTGVIKKIDGITVDVVDIKGKVVGTVSLPKEFFAVKINPVLMAQAVRVYAANQRKGTASTKTRGEIHASTRKIYRQKGTGRARHGAISAPIFVGGGVVFGPKPRDFSLHLPKKMRRLALASALTSKQKDGVVKIVAGLEKIEPKTKIMHNVFETLYSTKGKNGKTIEILLVLPEKVESVQRAARNIEGVTIRPAALLNTYEVLRSQRILFMKDAVEKLGALWTKDAS